jgi:hypothetical protein
MPFVFEGMRVIQPQLKNDDADGWHSPLMF